MNKIKCAIFCLFTLFNLSLFALSKQEIESKVKCAPELRQYFNSIIKVPEACTLLGEILEKGPIEMAVMKPPMSNQFSAYWDPDHRVVCVAMRAGRSQGSIIGSILFELHNASVNAKLDHFDKLAYEGKIGRDAYIESMEHLEYVNSLNAAKVAERGIQLGLFPRDARLPTYPTFQEHFAIQKQYGHSAHFGRNYDMLHPKNRNHLQTHQFNWSTPDFG